MRELIEGQFKMKSWRKRGSLVVLASALAACSFQNFDSMTNGGPARGGAGGRTAGGTGNGLAGATDANSGGSNLGGAAVDTGGATAGGDTALAGAANVGGFAGGPAAVGGGGGGVANGGGTGAVAVGGSVVSNAGRGGLAVGGNNSGGTSVGGTGTAGGVAGSGVAGSGVAGAAGSGNGQLLINPGFESAYNGWTIEPLSVRGTYVYVQWPTTGSVTPEGQFELSVWSQSVAFTAKIYQSLAGLADGKYTFKGWFNRGDGFTKVYLFAVGCGGADHQVNIPLGGASQWAETKIAGLDVVGGQCQVGLYLDSPSGVWLNADDFSFARDP